jgi:hypothetical protein
MSTRDPIIENVLQVLRAEFGPEWIDDEDANIRFSLQVEHVLRAIEGAHLIGEPEIEGSEITVNVWVDYPLQDLMGADQLAYDIFGRISDEVFFVARRIDSRGVRYPFVTGSKRHGHAGALVLAGPHAADFASRQTLRMLGGTTFHA